jgi:hypothetical protein
MAGQAQGGVAQDTPLPSAQAGTQEQRMIAPFLKFEWFTLTVNWMQ